MAKMPLMLKTKLVNAMFIIAILFGLAIVFVVILPRLSRLTSGRKTPNLPVVLEQVQTLSELVTVKYVMVKPVFHEPDNPSMLDYLPGGAKQVVIMAHGIVKAGIDLKELKTNDIEISGTKIRIKLPPTRVTDTYLDDKKTEIVDYKQGLLRAFDKNLEQDARRQAILDINRAAREAGILHDADDRARAQMESLFKQLGFTEVEFRSP